MENGKNKYKAKRKNWQSFPKEDWWLEGGTSEYDGKVYIVTVHKKDNGSFSVPEAELNEVEPDTLCQCTGKSDINNKIIWDNDILVSTDWPVGNLKVVWNAEGAGFGLVNLTRDISEEILEFSFFDGLEVVGNAFDMPLENNMKKIDFNTFIKQNIFIGKHEYGIVFGNKTVIDNNDYKVIACVSEWGTVNWNMNCYIPEEIRNIINREKMVLKKRFEKKVKEMELISKHEYLYRLIKEMNIPIHSHADPEDMLQYEECLRSENKGFRNMLGAIYFDIHNFDVKVMDLDFYDPDK